MVNLRVTDIADRFGINPSTVRSYNTRHQMPQPDGYDKHGPWWLPETIDGWDRPGRGRARSTQY